MSLSVRNRAEDFLWIFFIIIGALLIYTRSLSNGFIWDDDVYLSYNPHTHALWNLIRFFDFSRTSSAFPLALSALWLQHKWWGLNPWGYHAVSLAFHILNALLLFGLVRRFKPSLAGIAALLFTIHPIQVETVAWIAEQKNLFCFFFFMLAFHAFLDFDADPRRESCMKMLLFFVLALLSKCIAICFVAVPVLYAWWKRGTVSRQSLLLAGSFLLLGVPGILIPMRNENASFALWNVALLEKLVLAGKTYFFYIRQMMLPWQFLTFYPKWDISAAHGENWFFPCAVFALYFLLYRFRHRFGRGAFALLAFYGISIFPVLGFAKLSLFYATYASDHFTYLSTPPIFLLLCSAGSSLIAKLKSFLAAPGVPVLSAMIKILAVAGGLYLAVSSFVLTLHYQSSLVLFSQLIMRSPRSAAAYYQLGNACHDAPKLCGRETAFRFFEKAIQYDPGDFLSRERLASLYVESGLMREAAEILRQACPVFPPADRPSCYQRLESILRQQKGDQSTIPG